MSKFYGYNDFNGQKVILDKDGDTSITADTDDQIDVEIAGADNFQLTANTFTALAGSAIKTNTINETTAASGVTIDSVLLKDGGATFAGAVDFANYAATNLGAAGNDFGASNSLVATTFSGIIGRTNQATTLAAAATTLAVTKDFVTLTGDGGGNTLATITGGATGQILTILFVDALVTITDDATGNAGTVNLSAAFTSSANDVVTLLSNGTSWFETSRSVN